MKKMFLVLTLCFTLIFSSLNYKKSYAYGGVISLPLLATVGSLAVGTGIIINNNDDLYDLGRIFYDYIDRHNDLTWETVQAAFTASVSLQSNKLVSVKSDFLDIVKSFFDDTFKDVQYDNILYYDSVPFVDYNDISAKYHRGIKILVDGNDFSICDIYFERVPGFHQYKVYYKNKYISIMNIIIGQTFSFSVSKNYYSYDYPNTLSLSAVYRPYIDSPDYFTGESITLDLNFTGNAYGLPYTPGSYEWDIVDSKKENDSIALPVPGDLSQLVGQGSADFWSNTDDLVGSGDILIPGVDNPSIGLDGTISFPSVSTPDVPDVDNPSVPSEGIWATIKEFVIGLVVPSDTFWTDTWGGLYNNFTNSFPMVDMDGFNDLVTGEKKFPNIDINIMGITGRVVNGDVVNSIVDWLRPIIAGFMMICLMLFNYRKIYKLVRNSEPFEGIGKVENHAN